MDFFTSGNRFRIIILKCQQMETFSALLAICAGNSPVPGEFPAQRPATRRFDVFFDLRLNKRLSKQSWGWWFDTPSCRLWRHSNEMCRFQTTSRQLYIELNTVNPLQLRHNGRDGVLNRHLTSVYSAVYSGADLRELRVTGLCEGNSPVTGEFPAQMASNAENVSIWWRHHTKEMVLQWGRVYNDYP